MSKNTEGFESRVRLVRERMAMTQGELAERVGVSRQTINYIEQGTYCPSTKLALQLADELRASVEELFRLV